MIKKGKKGLGFAVGVEPLPTYFASKGCRILATDLWDSGTNSWIESGQNANGNYCLLNKYHFLSDKKFNQLVEYKNLDMNEIPNELNSFDFCWSSCAMEHVGSLELSKNFIKNMLSTLKPGGIAVHTTEFNLSSNVDTITEGDSILWREKDIEEVRDWLEANGHFIEVDFNNGIMEGDRFIDRPPYYLINPKYHLHLDILGYESTSFGFIIVKSK
jgi:SAM-dependent methyltransferase